MAVDPNYGCSEGGPGISADEKFSAAEARESSGGIFGFWQRDEEGLPQYAYTIDHYRDPRASYRVSGGMSNDHWHAVANDRITALAHNEGYVEVMDWDRCGRYLNRWEPEHRQYAGGFTFIKDKGGCWDTRWSRLPEKAVQERLFGIGYFEKRTRHEGLSITERVEAPPGDISALLAKTTFTNESDHEIEFIAVAYWGVNQHVLLPFPIMTHGLKGIASSWRRLFNRHFYQDAHCEPDKNVLWVAWRLKYPKRAPKKNVPALGDYHPNAVFLAALEPDLDKTYITDEQSFFTGDGADGSVGFADTADGSLVHNRCTRHSGLMMAFRYALKLRPGETRYFRHLYGYAPVKDFLQSIEKIKAAIALPKTRSYMTISTQGTPEMEDELRWHSYYLQGNTVRLEYYDCHVADQGSAYSMLHGAMGAHRDYALSILPLVYLRPDLARSMLQFSMRSQNARTGALPYAHIGFGKASGAGVHALSSDLDLFFLWALTEYLGATRDYSLLNESLPYYPVSSGRAGTGLYHVRTAIEHLIEKVGFGLHGLLRCGTGDWNDALIAFSDQKLTTIRKGESLLNAALAAYVLPVLAQLIEVADPELAVQARHIAVGQTAAARELWTGRWWARGYLGSGDRKIGEDRLFLDCQAFPVLAGWLDDEGMASLHAAIEEYCIHPQPAGATCLYPPMKGWLLEPGADTNGGVWAAVDAWTVWALSELDLQAGWDFFLRTTMRQRARTYPHIWYGIWSGPDACNAHYHKRPGETYFHVATPMTDFPVMNSNRHAGPLLDCVKLAGIIPRGDALHIEPKIPGGRFAFKSPLISIYYQEDYHRGEYTPVTTGAFSFVVQEPVRTGAQPLQLFVNNDPANAAYSNRQFHFSIDGVAGEMLSWELRVPES